MRNRATPSVLRHMADFGARATALRAEATALLVASRSAIGPVAIPPCLRVEVAAPWRGAAQRPVFGRPWCAPLPIASYARLRDSKSVGSLGIVFNRACRSRPGPPRIVPGGARSPRHRRTVRRAGVGFQGAAEFDRRLGKPAESRRANWPFLTRASVSSGQSRQMVSSAASAAGMLFVSSKALERRNRASLSPGRSRTHRSRSMIASAGFDRLIRSQPRWIRASASSGWQRAGNSYGRDRGLAEPGCRSPRPQPRMGQGGSGPSASLATGAVG